MPMSPEKLREIRLKNLTHVLTDADRAKGRATVKENREKSERLQDGMQALMKSKMKDKQYKGLSGAEAMCVDLFLSFFEQMDGAKKAKIFETIRDTAGEKPKETVDLESKSVKFVFEKPNGKDDDGNGTAADYSV